MSFKYEPGIIPEKYDSQWFREELSRLSALLNEPNSEHTVSNPLTAAPANPEEGMGAFADGTNWNPGFGAGPYIYMSGRWEPMSGKDFLIEVNKGLVPGHSLIHKFGQNLGASTTEQDVWGQGGILAFLTAAETMDVISTDTTNDISTGNNARTVELTGLDASFNVITETVTLGATAVTTTASFIRVYRMKVVTVGTYGVTNLGTITATASSAGTVQCDVSVGDGQSGTTHYTVPAGFTAYILRISITTDAGKTCGYHLHAREDADTVAAPFAPSKAIHHWEGIAQEGEELKANHILQEKTDVWFTAAMTSGTGLVAVDYDILLIDNTYLT